MKQCLIIILFGICACQLQQYSSLKGIKIIPFEMKSQVKLALEFFKKEKKEDQPLLFICYIQPTEYTFQQLLSNSSCFVDWFSYCLSMKLFDIFKFNKINSINIQQEINLNGRIISKSLTQLHYQMMSSQQLIFGQLKQRSLISSYLNLYEYNESSIIGIQSLQETDVTIQYSYQTNDECFYNCKNDSECRNSFCICREQQLGNDCHLPLDDIQTQNMFQGYKMYD